MLRTVLIFGLFIFSFTLCFAQNSESNEKVVFKADTEFSAQIENQIDAEKAKIGKDINFTINEDIKGEGSTIEKGSELYGRIVNVQKASAKNENTSKISIMFDFVKNDGRFLPLTAAVISIEENSQDIKLEQSPTFEGGTILFIKGKNLRVDKGKIFRIKLIEDITSK